MGVRLIVSLFSKSLQDFDRQSTPLKARGDVAKFVAKPQDKFSGNEKDNIFVHLEIFGDPVPSIQWFKVSGECR